MSRECQKFYARLAAMISEKRKQSYSLVASWLRRKLCFALINSVCMCTRGSRSICLSFIPLKRPNDVYFLLEPTAVPIWTGKSFLKYNIFIQNRELSKVYSREIFDFLAFAKVYSRKKISMFNKTFFSFLLIRTFRGKCLEIFSS